MARRGKDGKELYVLILEMHNKVADCLSHLAAEKESIEDAADALARVKKMRHSMVAELSKLTSGAGMEYDSERRLAGLRRAIDRLGRLIDEYDQKSKEMLGAAGDLAREWNQMEAEVHSVLEKLESKSPGAEPYIR